MLVVLSVLGTSPIHAQEAGSPRAFLEKIYSRYTASGKGPDTLGKDAADLFAPELLRLIREDQRRSRGEVGLLDHDPVCSCQDFEGVKVRAIDVTRSGRERANARVTFVNGGREVRVGYLLMRKSGQWRILDINEPDVPSLRRYLTAGLRK